MNVRALLRPVRRLWPQKVRTRLTLIYAALFFVAGSALLGLTYGLVASSLPTPSPAARRPSNQALGNLKTEFSGQELATLKRDCLPPGTQPVHRPEVAPVRVQAGGDGLRRRHRRGLAGAAPATRCGNLLVFSLVGLGVMTVASGGLGWFMSGRVLRPVRVITETARRASEQHLGERLALTGATDELKELADTFDDMLERLDAAFATQRRFVANASHELRTPLTVMRTAIDVTLAKPSPTARQLTDMAVRVRRSIDRAETMVEALLTLAVSDQGKLSTEFTDLATWAEDAIDAAAPEIERLDLHVDAELDPAETTGDPQLLERMICEPGRQRRPAQRARRLDQAAHRQQATRPRTSRSPTAGRSSPTTPCPRCSSRSGAWRPGPASATASGSACPSPGRSSPRTARPSPPAASPPAASTSRW